MGKKKLAKILETAGIYDQKLEPQIRLAERLESFLKRDDIEPKEELKALAQLQAAYTALGLTYSLKPDNIPEKKNNHLQDIMKL